MVANADPVRAVTFDNSRSAAISFLNQKNKQSVRDAVRVISTSTGLVHESWSLYWTRYAQPVPGSWLHVWNSPELLILHVCAFGNLITRPGQDSALPTPEIQREECSSSLYDSILNNRTTISCSLPLLARRPKRQSRSNIHVSFRSRINTLIKCSRIYMPITNSCQ